MRIPKCPQCGSEEGFKYGKHRRIGGATQRYYCENKHTFYKEDDYKVEAGDERRNPKVRQPV